MCLFDEAQSQQKATLSNTKIPQALIPVLVTGLQSTRVCASESLFRSKDLGWLDSCDKHRHEGC